MEDAMEEGDDDEETLVEPNDKVRQDFQNRYCGLKSELQAFQLIGCTTLKKPL